VVKKSRLLCITLGLLVFSTLFHCIMVRLEQGTRIESKKTKKADSGCLDLV